MLQERIFADPAYLKLFVRSLEEHHVRDLPPGQAVVLVLHSLGLSNQQAGVILGNSPHTAVNQARRAREKVVPLRSIVRVPPLGRGHICIAPAAWRVPGRA